MKNSLLIFGGGELQCSVIEKSKKLGYLTIVIDPNPNAIAKKKADIFIEVGGNDFENTLKIAKDYKVKGIVTAATDNPILMMARVAEELNLLFPSYESCETLIDKGKFKEILKKNSISHAEGKVYSRTDKIISSQFEYPVIVKPLMNSGSRGVIKCDNPESLLNAVNETLNFCKDGRYIIEKFIEGDEISVEALVYENKIHIIQITDKIVTPPPYNVEIGHIQPSKYSFLINDLTSLLQKIIDLTGLNNCAIHPELKINNGNISIIEIGPRLGGDYITSALVPLSTGIDIEENLIKISLGKKIKYKRIDRFSLINYLNFPIGSLVKGIITEEQLVNLFPEVIRFSHTLKVGSIINKITNSLNRYGYFILQSKNTDNIRESASKITKFITKNLLNI